MINNLELLIKDKKSRDVVSVKCSSCEHEFQTLVKTVRRKILENKDNFVCSKSCRRNNVSKKLNRRIKCTCDNTSCKKEFYKVNSQVSQHNYCCKSCAAIVNNTKHIKRVTENTKLCICGNRKDYQSIACKNCRREQQRNENYLYLTKPILSDIKSLFDSTIKLYSHIWRDEVRKRGRLLHKKFIKGEKVCKICNYSIYVELCHIKPIVDFPDTATLLEINGEENTVYLCPNHHKEFDNNLITL